ncbi:hypothetical protein [Pseudomonas sp. B392_1p]|uniref:hypothetical protein n=1 Tax=Pseudomonas sp. B392_1p TaxID=3457507 RepID=UPI003FD022DD
MANNYYDATGVLMLDRVTPVITALFGAFALDETYPGDGRAYIARISESNDAQWSDVLDGLGDLAGALDLAVQDDEPTIESLLWTLAAHFGTDQDEELAQLIEHHSFEDAADLDALFLIASRFDDGHHLSAILFEGCWHCGKPRLFEFGGDACFLSREVSLFGASSHTLELGAELRAAYLAGDLESACARITGDISRLISAFTDQQFQAKVRDGVAEHLLNAKSLAT